MVKALASFQRTMVSARSPYDRYTSSATMRPSPDAAKRGEVLFHSRPLSCFTCHGGVTSRARWARSDRILAVEFHNTGLYNLDGSAVVSGRQPGPLRGDAQPEDVGKFKAPTLRNIAVTAPYMHDGSVATLEDVIDHYAAGGRTIAEGPYRGVGHDNPQQERRDSRLHRDGGATGRSRRLPRIAHR